MSSPATFKREVSLIEAERRRNLVKSLSLKVKTFDHIDKPGFGCSSEPSPGGGRVMLAKFCPTVVRIKYLCMADD